LSSDTSHFKGYIKADNDNRSSSESNPVSEAEDTWKISIQAGSPDICPDTMNPTLSRQLLEHYARKQAINFWPGPRHPTFNSHIARVKSFEDVDWPETNPSPLSMAEAGLFYDSKLIIFLVISFN
jgi:hypothetical protein